MSRLSHFLFALSLAVPLAACSDEASDGGDETPEPTLTEALTTAGLPPGNWRVENGGNSVCIRTFNAPGGVQATESIGMSGFGTFELRVSEDDAISLYGTTDELDARWLEETQCLVHELATDAVHHHEACEDEERGCPPFSLVRLCANAGSPTFFAQVPECGQNTFPAVAQ